VTTRSAKTTCLLGTRLVDDLGLLDDDAARGEGLLAATNGEALLSNLSLGEAELLLRLSSICSLVGGGGGLISDIPTFLSELQWVKEIQTSPTDNCLQGNWYLPIVLSGLELLQPWPNTKKGCSRVASTATYKIKFEFWLMYCRCILYYLLLNQRV
jgi:hypothetical protein